VRGDRSCAALLMPNPLSSSSVHPLGRRFDLGVTNVSEGLQFQAARRSPTQLTRGIRSTLVLARVAAAPTAEAERNVGSSPVCEAASEVRPQAAVLPPGTARHGPAPEPVPRRSPGGRESRVGMTADQAVH
jgi:hypothetical protein